MGWGQAVIANGCRYLIIRTSWLHSPWRTNFLKTMMQLARDRD
ncbi:sugar nucleotide-binding protein [Aeromonas veronii]